MGLLYASTNEINFANPPPFNALILFRDFIGEVFVREIFAKHFEKDSGYEMNIFKIRSDFSFVLRNKGIDLY